MNLNAARNSILATLKTTDWPNGLAELEGLIRAAETPLQLERLPRDESRFLPESKAAIERHVEDLMTVHGILRKESAKYGTKGKGISKWFKNLAAKTDSKECAGTFRICQSSIKDSVAALNDHLQTLEVGNDNVEQRASTDNAGPSPEIDQTLADQDVNRYQRWNNVLSGTRTTLQVAEGLSKLIPVVGPFVEATASVGIKLVEMAQMMSGNNEVSKNLKDDVCRLYDILDKFTNAAGQQEAQIVEEGVVQLQRELLNVQNQISAMQFQHDLKKLLRSSEHSESLKSIQEKLRTALEELQLLVSLNTASLIAEHHKESEQRRLLDSLGDGLYGARGNRIEDAICLEGTRVEILERIDTWIRDVETSKRVLWISGTAGRGKSAILSTVAHNWRRRASCAIFHFRRDQSARDGHLICALARQLGKSLDPDLRSAILSTVAKTDDIASKRLDEQFNILFTTSFNTLKVKPSPILMFVDALDECESVDYAVEFIKLIKEHSTSLPANVKFVITSRPEPRLQSLLKGIDYVQEQSLDETAGVNSDIERFIDHAFGQIRLEHKLKSNWPPSPNPTPKLVSMSQGLFQWARTTMKYIGEKSPVTRLTRILTKSQDWSGVDFLYDQILSDALKQVDTNSAMRDLLLASLGTIVVSVYPISLEELALLHSGHELTRENSHEGICILFRDDILSDITSLISIPKSSSEPIRLMHTSIRDLLTDAKRCEGRAYRLNLEEIHRQLARSCLILMNQRLKENICDLPDFTKASSKVQDIVSTNLPKGLLYSCSCWTIHLKESGRWFDSAPGLIEGELTLFTEGKILFWLEVMSLVDRAHEAANMASQTCTWLSASPYSSLIALWSDTHRFVIAFLEPISYGPLHIYSSALGQCPVKTALWERYGKYAKIKVLRGLHQSTWSSTLWAHDASRNSCVAFSPDGDQLAFAEQGLRVRDTKTGRLAGRLCGRFSSHPEYLSYSSDGSYLAISSFKVWATLLDTRTGSLVGKQIPPEEDYSYSDDIYTLPSVDYLSNRNLLACRTARGVRLMDPVTQSQVGSSLRYEPHSVQALTCSPSGKLVALAWGHAVRLFDPHDWREVGGPLTGHWEKVECIRFSPDEKLLVSGAKDTTIRVWDLQTFEQLGEPLKGHRSSIRSLCFSQDGKRLASGSQDSIRVWNPRTGSQTEKAMVRNDLPGGICFSSDGQLLSARFSGHEKLELVHPQSLSKLEQTDTFPVDEFKTLRFLPDGTLLATGHRALITRLWSLRTGKEDGQLIGSGDGREYDHIGSLSFSPDGQLLASASDSGTIQLWDLQTRKLIGEAQSPWLDTKRYTTFSADGKWLFGSSDNKLSTPTVVVGGATVAAGIVGAALYAKQHPDTGAVASQVISSEKEKGKGKERAAAAGGGRKRKGASSVAGSTKRAVEKEKEKAKEKTDGTPPALAAQAALFDSSAEKEQSSAMED
ncbi:hypothetical protein FRB90_004844, partial [Tulasnella sp. 427]